MPSKVIHPFFFEATEADVLAKQEAYEEAHFKRVQQLTRVGAITYHILSGFGCRRHRKRLRLRVQGFAVLLGILKLIAAVVSIVVT